MSTRYERLMEQISAAAETVSDDTYFVLEEQSKKAAANCLLRFGSEILSKPEGFIIAACQLGEATLAWLLAQGYISMTEKGLASEDEVAKKREARATRTAQSPTPVHAREGFGQGYL